MTNMAAGVRRNNLGLVIFGKGAGGKLYKRYVRHIPEMGYRYRYVNVK